MRCCNRNSNNCMQNSCNCGCNNSNTNGCNSSIYANICNSSNNKPFPSNYLYGHAYTPNQIMNKTFTPEVGLENGTIFPELVSPYYPGQSIDFINYLRNGGM